MHKADSTAVFDAYAGYYDLLYQDKDYAGEARYIRGLLKRFASKSLAVLEIGSGTGRHALEFARMGYDVTGIERSGDMLKQARKLVGEARGLRRPPRFQSGDFQTFRAARRFDAALSLFHVVSYLPENGDVLAAFRNTRRHLKRGGTFIFDVWYGPAVLKDRPAVRIKRCEGHDASLIRLAEPILMTDRNLVDVHYHVMVRSACSGDVREIREVHRMRYFFLPELDQYLQMSNFRRVHAEEWMSAAPVSTDPWGLAVVARAV